MKFIKPLIILLLGIAIGWLAGYLNIPFIEIQDPYWLGFNSCLFIIIFLFSLKYIWKNKSAKSNYSQGYPSRIALFLALVIVLGGLTIGTFGIRSKMQFEKQNKRLTQTINTQIDLIDSLRINKQILLMNNVLSQIDHELNQDSLNRLSTRLLNRIVNLSQNLQPYRYYIGDSLTKVKLSPERGNLLLTLTAMDIDSISFDYIKRNANFVQADLRDKEFKNLDLSGINLEGADLQNTSFQACILNDAKLKKANLKGTQFTNVSMEKCNLNNTDLRWSALKNVSLFQAELSGVDLSNSSLVDLNLRESTIQFSDISNSVLKQVDFSISDLLNTSFKESNLNDVNFEESRLRKANLDASNMNGVNLNKAIVDKNWQNIINSWKVVNQKNLLKKYEVVIDSSIHFRSEKYFLKKK